MRPFTAILISSSTIQVIRLYIFRFIEMTFYYHYTDYETRMGYLDLKSSPGVYFYVGRNSDYNSTRTVIPYEKERLNIGGGLDLTTGIFTAPTNGRYQFNLVAFANGDRSGVQLRLK